MECNRTEEYFVKTSWVDGDDKPQWNKEGPLLSKAIATHAAMTRAGDLGGDNRHGCSIEVIFVVTETCETVVESIVPPQEYNTGDGDSHSG